MLVEVGSYLKITDPSADLTGWCKENLVMDGQKYHSSPESYYNEVRGTSDELCRENDLSVIAPQGKGKHYGEWKAEQDGKPTVRSIVREDIDRIIGEAYTYQTFLLLLQRNGYEIKSGPSRKYTAVRPPGAKRFVRLDSLGEGYTEEAIKQRLTAQRSGKKNISQRTAKRNTGDCRTAPCRAGQTKKCR